MVGWVLVVFSPTQVYSSNAEASGAGEHSVIRCGRNHVFDLGVRFWGLCIAPVLEIGGAVDAVIASVLLKLFDEL